MRQLQLKHAYNYHLLVGKEQHGYKGEIVNRFTFHNAFQGEEDEWFTTEIKYPTKHAVILLIFPKDKPCTKIIAATRFADEQWKEIVDNIPVITEGGRLAYWSAMDLRGASKVRLRFNW